MNKSAVARVLTEQTKLVEKASGQANAGNFEAAAKLLTKANDLIRRASGGLQSKR